MDTDSFIVHVKTEYIHKDTAEDIETRFSTGPYVTFFGPAIIEG